MTKVSPLEREWEGDVMAGKNPKVVQGRAWVLLRARGCWAPLEAGNGEHRTGWGLTLPGFLHLAKASGCVLLRTGLSRAFPGTIYARKCRKNIARAGQLQSRAEVGMPAGWVGAARV